MAVGGLLCLACLCSAGSRSSEAEPLLRDLHNSFKGDIGIDIGTQRLQCSSFFGYDLFLAEGLLYTAQKGTTFEPLGIDMDIDVGVDEEVAADVEVEDEDVEPKLKK